MTYEEFVKAIESEFSGPVLVTKKPVSENSVLVRVSTKDQIYAYYSPRCDYTDLFEFMVGELK